MLGAGGIFVVALSAYFGRLPILFWFSILAFVTAAWSAAAKSFESFEAARILHGFFSTVAQAVCISSHLYHVRSSPALNWIEH
jgi:predicted MFS family arabinose efflux permease